MNLKNSQTINIPEADFSSTDSGSTSRRSRVAKIRYLLAASAGLIAPFVIIYLYLAPWELIYTILFFLSILVSAIIMFHTLHQMVVDRFSFVALKLPTYLLLASLSFYIGLTILSFIIFDHHPLDLFLTQASLLEKAFYFATAAGIFVTIAALTLLSYELANLPHSLWGFLYPLRYVILVLSILFMIENLAVINAYLSQVDFMVAVSIAVIQITEMLVLMSLVVNLLFLSIIFFQAAFRKPTR